MGDREFLRRELWWLVGACLLLVACIKHAPILCGAQEPCPSGSSCSEGECVTAAEGCPDAPPLAETIIADTALTCTYGEECCCGQCHPSIKCTALAGEELGCFYTEACMMPACQRP